MDVFRQMLSVLLVFALLGAALWALRKGRNISFRGLSWKRGEGRVKSIAPVERVVLTPQHMLHVVRINGREIVVVTYPTGCTEIGQSPEPRPADRASRAGA